MRLPLFLVLVLFLWVSFSGRLCRGGITSQYLRTPEYASDMPEDADVFKPPPGYNAPQQVHITQGDFEGKAVIVSWVTPIERGSSEVLWGTQSGVYLWSASGEVTRYTSYNYTSGYIHHCTLKDLRYETKYYYKLGNGSSSAREFTFVTPPEAGPDIPYTFGVIGDLGQTYDSNSTFQHYMKSGGQSLLLVGDMSYADKYPYYDGRRWDTWLRFIEPSAAFQPWIWAVGNHEIEYGPTFGATEAFHTFYHRFRTPHSSSGSTSPMWYSIRRGPAHIIVLSSYSGFAKYTPQWRWLENELPKVDRKKTPWLIVIAHAPIYNSNSKHYMEGEAMRSVFEESFVQYKVDMVLSGHVHSYERMHRVSNVKYDIMNGECLPVISEEAPVYLVVGDGGNCEGLAQPFLEPQPFYSAFREASFGHGILEIKNRTHALFYWHRNHDGNAVVADSFWFENRYWKSTQGSAQA